jgi:hypothetical protein
MRETSLLEVLANVRRGRVAYLSLTRDQRRQFYDPDGKLALDVLRHLLGARTDRQERFPLTEGAFLAVARRLGHEIGQKRSRRLIKRLLTTGVVASAGSYRQPYRESGLRTGFKVALHRLGRYATRPETLDLLCQLSGPYVILFDEHVHKLRRDQRALCVIQERLDGDYRRTWFAPLYTPGPAKPSTYTKRSLYFDMIGSHADR